MLLIIITALALAFLVSLIWVAQTAAVATKRANTLNLANIKLRARERALEDKLQDLYGKHVLELLDVSNKHAEKVRAQNQAIDYLKAACSDHLKSLELALSGRGSEVKSKAGAVTLKVNLDTTEAQAKVADLRTQIEDAARPLRDARGRFAPKVLP